MTAATARVEVHLLDPIPGVVVATVMDGLRNLGLDAELRAAPQGPKAPIGPGDGQVYLTSRADASDEVAHVVALPRIPGASRFDRGVAKGVLAQVLVHVRRALPAR